MPLTPGEFEYVYKYIIQAKEPEGIFGKLGNGSIDDQIKIVNKLFRKLSLDIHPDMYPDKKLKYMANEAFQELNRLEKEAEEKIRQGRYGTKTPTPVTNKTVVISEFEAGSSKYRIFSESISGDYCQILMGEREDSNGVEQVCLKISIDVGDNDLMRNEADILRFIQHKSLPTLLDSFSMGGRYVNVLRRIPGSDLVYVKLKFTNGLPQEHMVWVLDRLLSVLGFLHINNIIHGSIEPGNIMVIPNTHNGLLIDFVLSVADANTPDAVYQGVNNYTAPEIVNKSDLKPHPSADIYSLGMSMLFVLGGDPANQSFPKGIDPRLETFIKTLINPDPRKRASDAWKSWHELHELRKEIFGAANQFLPLSIS